jgi:N-carbamoylputrescine amidase
VHGACWELVTHSDWNDPSYCEPRRTARSAANYAPPDANGHSIAFDPIAFTEKGSRDSLVVEAGEQEGVYLASFDLDAIREYRARELWGNAFRKPHRYGLLVEQRVEDPFVRVNIHGEPYQSSQR